MKIVCVIDLDETLGHFNANNQFLVRPFAHFLLDFLIVANIDIVLWSYGSDFYVEHIINEYFNIFMKDSIRTRVYGRTACEISKHRFGYTKCSKVLRNIYKDVILIAMDDQVNVNMDSGYDLRIHVEPYKEKNENDNELFQIACKIIEYCKNIMI